MAYDQLNDKQYRPIADEFTVDGAPLSIHIAYDLATGARNCKTRYFRHKLISELFHPPLSSSVDDDKFKLLVPFAPRKIDSGVAGVMCTICVKVKTIAASAQFKLHLTDRIPSYDVDDQGIYVDNSPYTEVRIAATGPGDAGWTGAPQIVTSYLDTTFSGLPLDRYNRTYMYLLAKHAGGDVACTFDIYAIDVQGIYAET